MKNKIIGILTLITLYLLWNIFSGGDLPIKQYFCGKGFVDCKVVARFDDMDSCQYSVRQRSWYCDSRDLKNITCEEKESELVDAYCSK